MQLDDYQFQEEADCPWAEAEMDRVIFKDCSVRIRIDSCGTFYEAGETEDENKQPVTLTAYYEIVGSIVDHHRAAFAHFLENAQQYEERLLAYLAAAVNRVADSALAENNSAELRTQIAAHALREVNGVKKLISWSGLSLYDHGWEGVGFVTMDFACGWDEEHGISILMHKGRIIAESGLADFSNRGDSLIEHAKCLQEFSTGYDIQLP